MHLTKVMGQSQEVRPQDECEGCAESCEEADTTERQGHFPETLKDGKRTTGQHRQVEFFEDPNRCPEGVRYLTPNAKVLMKIEEEEPAEEEYPTQTEVFGPYRLEPEMHPSLAELLHLWLTLRPPELSEQRSTIWFI